MNFYVCFWRCNPVGLKPWQWGRWREWWGWRRSGPSFYHVSCFFQDGDRWIHVNCDRHALTVICMAEIEFTEFLADITLVADVLCVPQGDEAKFLTHGWFTCITQTKHLIGRGGSALSPNGLWDRLISENAEIVYGTEARKL